MVEDGSLQNIRLPVIFLAKINPRSSRTVSMRQLSFFCITVNKLYKAVRWMSVAGSEDQERNHAFLRLTKLATSALVSTSTVDVCQQSVKFTCYHASHTQFYELISFRATELNVFIV